MPTDVPPAEVVTPDDVRSAADQIHGVVHRTPLLTCAALDAATGARVHVKAEHLQRTGSFKLRGATNAISRLDPATTPGVVAWSSGNHAQAVAAAAARAGLTARIVMPTDAPALKLQATRALGAEVTGYDRRTEDREAIGRALAARHGATVIPPYDHPHVIAGQGTVGLELGTDLDAIDVAVVCVGGGGLMAGTATALTDLHPGITIVGVEPAGADDTVRALAAGHRLPPEHPPTGIADGLLAPAPGELTFPIIQRLVDRVVTVTDDEIRAAMRFAATRMKQVVEPSGAVGLAALLHRRIDVSGARVGVVVSGGNVDLVRLGSLLAD